MEEREIARKIGTYIIIRMDTTRYNVFIPSLVSNPSYNSSCALFLAFASSFFASRCISLYSCYSLHPSAHPTSVSPISSSVCFPALPHPTAKSPCLLPSVLMTRLLTFLLCHSLLDFRFLVSKVMLHANSRCCLATFSRAITLQYSILLFSSIEHPTCGAYVLITVIISPSISSFIYIILSDTLLLTCNTLPMQSSFRTTPTPFLLPYSPW